MRLGYRGEAQPSVGRLVQAIPRRHTALHAIEPRSRQAVAITVERGVQARGFERELTARIIDEARRYHLNDVRVQEQSSSRRYKIPVLELHSYS